MRVCQCVSVGGVPLIHLLGQMFGEQLKHLSVLLWQPVDDLVDLSHPGLWVVQLWRGGSKADQGE